MLVRCKLNFEGFCENFTYLMFINKKRMTKTQGVYTNVWEALSFLLFSLDEA